MFEHIEPFAGDPILSLNEDFQKDPRPHKINLSIGIYFDDEGRIPVLDCVKKAEAQLLEKGGAKPYLPIEGNADFRRAVPAKAGQKLAVPRLVDLAGIRRGRPVRNAARAPIAMRSGTPSHARRSASPNAQVRCSGVSGGPCS